MPTFSKKNKINVWKIKKTLKRDQNKKRKKTFLTSMTDTVGEGACRARCRRTGRVCSGEAACARTGDRQDRHVRLYSRYVAPLPTATTTTTMMKIEQVAMIFLTPSPSRVLRAHRVQGIDAASVHESTRPHIHPSVLGTMTTKLPRADSPSCTRQISRHIHPQQVS